MQTSRADPIIAEVRAARDKHVAQFDYNVDAIFADTQSRKTNSGPYIHPPSAEAIMVFLQICPGRSQW